MQAVRNGVGSGGEPDREDRKMLIKSEDREKFPSHSEQEKHSAVENSAECAEKDRNNDPEVRTFVLAENQCIVYSPRVGGEESRLNSPPPPPPPTRSSFHSHLPPKKTLKLALSMPAAAAALTVASGQGPRRGETTSLLPPPPPPPPLALRRSSPEPSERMARIHIVSKGHQQNNDGPVEDGRGVLVGAGGQGVHVIRDGRFYQPEPPEPREPAPNQRNETHRRSYDDRYLVDQEVEEGSMGLRDDGRRAHHGSIIVVNGSATVASISRIPSPASQHEDADDRMTQQQQHRVSQAHATTTTILVTNDRPSTIYKPAMATSSNATVSSSNKTPQHPLHAHPNGLQHHQQQQQQQPTNGHVTSMQPPPPPPPLKQISKSGGSGGHEEPSSSMPDLAMNCKLLACPLADLGNKNNSSSNKGHNHNT